ncbi:MAG: PAAR domain-containing protein [Byssovorax sp.]
MSGPLSLAAARVGDRISHAAHVAEQDSEVLLGVALGALNSVAHTAGALAAAIGAGLSTGREPGHVKIATSAVSPITTSGTIREGSPDTFLGGPSFNAALATKHKVDCDHHSDKPIRKGSASVFANGKRLARMTDETGCGAIIADGLLTVLVGGATVDDAPPDPLAAVSHGAAVAAAAVGAALRAGAGAAETAIRWGEGLATAALNEAGAVVTQVEASVIVVEGEIAAKAAALVGEVKGGALGSLFGALLGDRSKP